MPRLVHRLVVRVARIAVVLARRQIVIVVLGRFVQERFQVDRRVGVVQLHAQTVHHVLSYCWRASRHIVGHAHHARLVH